MCSGAYPCAALEHAVFYKPIPRAHGLIFNYFFFKINNCGYIHLKAFSKLFLIFQNRKIVKHGLGYMFLYTCFTKQKYIFFFIYNH